MHLGVAETGLRDGALGIVDDRLSGNAVEGLESPPVAGKPGGHRLVPDDLGVHVAAEAKGHHEDPGLHHLTGEHVGDGGAFPEIHLGRLAGLEVETTGGLGLFEAKLLNQTADGGVAPLEPVLVHQGPVDRRYVDLLFGPF